MNGYHKVCHFTTCPNIGSSLSGIGYRIDTSFDMEDLNIHVRYYKCFTTLTDDCVKSLVTGGSNSLCTDIKQEFIHNLTLSFP